MSDRIILLNKNQIREIIPHREPMLLVDEVIALEPGRKCIARTYVKEDDFWFKGHFPEMPVTPGVLLIEMLAQTGAICAGTLPENKGKIALFAKIDKAKFRRQVVPGDIVTLEVEMLKLKGNVGIGKAIASVDGQLAVTGQLTFAFQK